MNLSYDCLKKMANDPEFAKEIEWNLSGEVAANSMVYGWAQRDGVVLGGRTVTISSDFLLCNSPLSLEPHSLPCNMPEQSAGAKFYAPLRNWM